MSALLGSSAAPTTTLQCFSSKRRSASAVQQQLGARSSGYAAQQALRQRQQALPSRAAWNEQEPLPKELTSDPEAKYRQYGEHFGKSYFLQDVIQTAPRVRVRTSADRARDQLADLAVLNERLAGKAEKEAATIRQRLEYLKRRRRNWELVYQHVLRADALCTLSAIEEAAARVDQLLSEDSRERHSVSALKRQLVELQGEVAEAHSRLHLTQARVEHNLRRISELKEESQRMENTMARSGTADPQLQQLQELEQALGGSLATAAATVALPRSSAPVVRGAPTTPAASQQEQRQQRQRELQQRRRGLHSSLEIEEEMKNHWFAVAFASKLAPDVMVPFELFGQPWVLFKDAQGRPVCVRDECAHRACPLSMGRVVDGTVECPYHGWRFNGQGECTKMPSTTLCRGVAVSSLPCVELDGFVWVWPGWEPPTEVPAITKPPEGYRIHAEIEVEVPVEHGLLVENLLDLAHAPFTHTSTFARGWPVPDAVKFHASRLLGGYWDPYPIEMSFNPPCMTLSHIGLARPGALAGAGGTPQDCRNHLHQLHVCLPSRPGHTRLLYRMATDFLWWTEAIPGIHRFWRYIAGQVLGEDLVLVVGQQDRLLRGGDTWRHPVSYDKLAVRYRRWRNSLSASASVGGVAEGDAEAATAAGSQPFTMTSGELFALEDPDQEEQHMFVDVNTSS